MAGFAIGAGIQALGSLGGALIGAAAAKKAAARQAAAAQAVSADTMRAVTGAQGEVAGSAGMADQLLAEAARRGEDLYSPYTGVGKPSLDQLQELTGAGGSLDKTFSFAPQDLSSDPGYEFTLQQGQKAIQRAAAARGGLFSGATLKSLAGYTTGTANQYFNDAFTRAQSTFNTNRQTALSRITSLQDLARMGMAGASDTSRLLENTAARRSQTTLGATEFNANLGMEGLRIRSNATTAQGNAEAAGTMGAANAWSGGLAGVGNAAASGINSYLTSMKLKELARMYRGGSGRGSGDITEV